MSDRMGKRAMLLRTCKADGSAHGGFQWPTEPGSVVRAPDWNPKPECGGGLHGLLWGQGYASLLNWNGAALWMVVSAEAASVVDISGKVKVPECRVECAGSRAEATQYLYRRAPAGTVVHGLVMEGGHGSTLTGGDRSTLTGGDGSTLTGGSGSTLTGGDRSILTGGDGSTLTGGYGSTLCGRWWDGARYRLTVVYPGEGGIEVGVPYLFRGGKFKRAGK